MVYFGELFYIYFFIFLPAEGFGFSSVVIGVHVVFVVNVLKQKKTLTDVASVDLLIIVANIKIA